MWVFSLWTALLVGACVEVVACRTQAPSWRGVGHTHAHTWCLGCLSGGWAHPSAHVPFVLLPMSWALLSAHVAFVLRWVSHDRSLLETSGAWVMVPDSRGMGWMSWPMINGSSVRIQFYWVLHQDSMFMGPKILNIIICFTIIIIFIIINIINKIINKFERKYYYLYYKFLLYFL